MRSITIKIAASATFVIALAACTRPQPPSPPTQAALPEVIPATTPKNTGPKIWYTPDSTFTECIEARTGPADRIEQSSGLNPIVAEKDGGQIVDVKVYQGSMIATWTYYRDPAVCASEELQREKKLADKYR